MTFNKLVPLEEQATIAQKSFQILKEQYLARKQKQQLAEAADPALAASRAFKEAVEAQLNVEDSGFTPKAQKNRCVGKKFYETNRKFKNLVPVLYNRTLAPRISAKGSTLHGMKKDLSGKILKSILRRWQAEGRVYSILDLDMSAAHARFAIALQGTKNTQLFQAVENSGKFWDEKATYYQKQLSDKDYEFTHKQVRDMLKVSLYTSLNGGNPFGIERLFKNLSDQKPELTKGFTSKESFEGSKLFTDINGTLQTFELIHEVKALNKKCVTDNGRLTWTLDKTSPYNIDSEHKGISRALQGFEIVLLSVLVNRIVARGGLPINLAHDGCMAVFPGIIDEKQLTLELSEDIKGWASYLLDGLTLPIECKFNYNVANTTPEPLE